LIYPYSSGQVFAYFAYGLGIRSELALPGLITDEANPDVFVRFGKLDTLLAPADDDGYSFRAFAGSVCFGWERVGRFRIREGQEITIAPVPGIEEGVLRALLLGPALAVLLQQRGILILHGSANALRGAVVAFLGQKGAGKSTTAATLHARGYAVVADDVVAIRTDAGVPLVFPAYPQLNLWPDAVASLGHDLATSPRLHSRVEKRAMRAMSGFPRDPLPLQALYVLGKGTRNEVEILRPQEAFVELLRHSYGTRLYRGSAAPQHFRQLAGLVKAVPVRRLKVRQTLTELSSLSRLVEEDAAQNSTWRS
jgi:hypothetical protein